MEEKRIKLPRKYCLIKGKSLSNRDKYFKEGNKNDKTNSYKTINENSITSASDSTYFTNKKKNKSLNYIYKKNVSREKGKIFLSKSRKIDSMKKINTKFQSLLNQSPSFRKNNEEISLINNAYRIFKNKNNILSYSNIIKKIHGNKEIQDKIKIHTIKNSNNIAIVNNNFNKSKNYFYNKTKNNYFINIEDLMLLEEKFNDVLKSIKLKSNIANECLEFINFYSQSSLFNKFENYFRDKNSKIISHNSLILIIFDIILIYHLSFEQTCINSSFNYLMKIVEMNYNSYLLLCNYISDKVSSNEKENIWVKKLKIMLKENLTHLSLNNEEYTNFLLLNNFNMNNDTEESFTKSFIELKFYTYIIEKYIKILFKFLDNKYLNKEFIDIFQNLKNTSIEELKKFFFSKILRVINKDASIGGGIIYNYEGEKIQKEEKVPYITAPLLKKFSLILDLDETLISFQMDQNNKNKGLLKFRPGLDEFLQSVKKYYEIIVFTSATKEYADSIENEIENEIKYFDYRLYRQHAIIYDNYLVKDISRIGRPLEKIIIIDNMPQNYMLQKENGIMIKPYWGGDDYDTALISLEDILIKIACNFDDVRKGILFYKDDIVNKVSSNFSRKEKNLLNTYGNYK